MTCTLNRTLNKGIRRFPDVTDNGRDVEQLERVVEQLERVHLMGPSESDVTALISFHGSRSRMRQ